MPNILVTGASSGIGEATARYLSQMGYTLVLVARNKEKLSQLSSSLPGETLVIPYDLGDLTHIEEIFSKCKQEGIVLDGLVHSAGLTLTNPLKTNEISTMENIFRINYEAFVELTRCFSMRNYSNKGASIVAISSIASVNAKEGLSVYASSKAAVNASVRIFAKELSRRKIRVNAVLPANTRTPMTEGLEDRFGIEGFIDKVQPFGMIDPLAVAYLVEFLLSEKASYITGALIPISAGAV